jgi:hypothetical protein
MGEDLRLTPEQPYGPGHQVIKIPEIMGSKEVFVGPVGRQPGDIRGKIRRIENLLFTAADEGIQGFDIAAVLPDGFLEEGAAIFVAGDPAGGDSLGL